MPTTRDRWARRVQQWEQSGLTAGAFAAEWDINPRTLAHWKWKLAKEQDAAGGVTSPAFVEVTPPASTWWQSADRIEIVIDDRLVVRVPDAFDASVLRRVIDALTVDTEDGA
ncbi:MAG: IS66 family insertion sequence element accessory protein TnpB [Polyangiaceae bacterium]|nr:IS66 family insertion sequence element accessory protein TnpB [Polyangiaceae bacterium]